MHMMFPNRAISLSTPFGQRRRTVQYPPECFDLTYGIETMNRNKPSATHIFGPSGIGLGNLM